MKFHENLSSVNLFFHVDRWTDRRTDMMKLVVAFLNFANAPENLELQPFSLRLSELRSSNGVAQFGMPKFLLSPSRANAWRGTKFLLLKELIICVSFCLSSWL